MWRYVIAGLLMCLSAVAHANDMIFSLQEKDLRPNLDLFQWIFADGEITTGTTERFQNFVQSHPQLIAGATVIFNSPGGSPMEAIHLGEAISDSHFRTDVAIAGPSSMTEKPGICASACLFSYLGGTYRYLHEGSLIGIHRFRFSQDFGGDQTAAVSQLLSGVMVNFIKKQRADPALFTLMTQTASNDISFLTAKQLADLNVVTNDVFSESWTFEVNGRQAYLKADQVSYRGENKLLFICGAHPNETPAILMAMSELPDREEIIRDARQLILFVDKKDVSFPIGPDKPEMQGGKYVAWIIPLSPAMIARLENATSIGAGISPSPGIFSGFEGISTKDGHDKLVKFLDGCMAPQQSPSASTVQPSSPSRPSGQSDVDITRRVAHNFDAQYKKAGMAGMQISVEACYASVRKSRKISSLEYCYLLDSMASGMDKAASEQNHWPEMPYFFPEKVTQRTASIFSEIRNDPAANEREITRWRPLLIFVFSELEAIGKQ